MPDYGKLKEKLESLYRTYNSSYLYSDPLKYLHLYDAPGDQEVVGLIASSLAYGRVDGIFRSVEKVIEKMGSKPADFVRNFDPHRDAGLFRGFVHRFNRGEDVACLIYFIKQILDGYGSVGVLFAAFIDEEDENTERALTAFTEYVLSLDSTPFYGGGKLPARAGVRYFFPSPRDGSPCKRLNLFLRWMARPRDGLDLGAWDSVPASKLVIPLDTHIARISQYIGLTTLKNPSWKMAVEITENLKRLDPADPLKYDFALSRLGILDLCPRKRDDVKCADCGISDICML